MASVTKEDQFLFHIVDSKVVGRLATFNSKTNQWFMGYVEGVRYDRDDADVFVTEKEAIPAAIVVLDTKKADLQAKLTQVQAKDELQAEPAEEQVLADDGKT